jgi:hypothetical protein
MGVQGPFYGGPILSWSLIATVFMQYGHGMGNPCQSPLVHRRHMGVNGTCIFSISTTVIERDSSVKPLLLRKIT